jgi:hypothetical protein
LPYAIGTLYKVFGKRSIPVKTEVSHIQAKMSEVALALGTNTTGNYGVCRYLHAL